MKPRPSRISGPDISTAALVVSDDNYPPGVTGEDIDIAYENKYRDEVNQDEGQRLEDLGVVVAHGNCKVCGCPPERTPMIFRGTGWCCENHHKMQEKK